MSILENEKANSDFRVFIGLEDYKPLTIIGNESISPVSDFRKPDDLLVSFDRALKRVDCDALANQEEEEFVMTCRIIYAGISELKRHEVQTRKLTDSIFYHLSALDEARKLNLDEHEERILFALGREEERIQLVFFSLDKEALNDIINNLKAIASNHVCLPEYKPRYFPEDLTDVMHNLLGIIYALACVQSDLMPPLAILMESIERHSKRARDQYEKVKNLA